MLIQCTCAGCGRVFSRHAHRVRGASGPWCSVGCLGVAQRRTGPSSCETCGGTFRVPASEVRKGGGRYCSQTCHYASYWTSPVERFWARVNQSGECWLWTGQRIHGYGRLRLRTPEGRDRYIPAHRVSWELANGPIPPGLRVLHRCDVPACVRPEHLFLGTPTDNVADMVAKGRQQRGDHAALAKLTAAQVLEIRRLVASREATQAELARRYGVKPGTISSVVLRTTWRHL